MDGYSALSRPSKYIAPFTYRAVDAGLFERIETMKPTSTTTYSVERDASGAAVAEDTHKGP